MPTHISTRDWLVRTLEPLKALPFVLNLDVRLYGADADRVHGADAFLELTTPENGSRFVIEHKRTNLTVAIADGVIAHARNSPDLPWLLAAPYVPPGIAAQLANAGVNYIDAAGNCRLSVSDRYFASLEGKRPQRKPPEMRAMRLAGYQVLFTILARAEAVGLTVRDLAGLADVGKTAAAETLRSLEAEGLVGRRPRRLLEPRELLDRWLAGYATYVRARLFVGEYRTPHADGPGLEGAIERAAGATDWAWGGGTAAFRLTQYYRGEVTVLHVVEEPHALLREIRALRSDRPTLRVLRVPGPVGLEGAVSRTAHPLLVYTELYAEGHERARDAAREMGRQYLEDLL